MALNEQPRREYMRVPAKGQELWRPAQAFPSARYVDVFL